MQQASFYRYAKPRNMYPYEANHFKRNGTFWQQQRTGEVGVKFLCLLIRTFTARDAQMCTLQMHHAANIHNHELGQQKQQQMQNAGSVWTTKFKPGPFLTMGRLIALWFISCDTMCVLTTALCFSCLESRSRLLIYSKSALCETEAQTEVPAKMKATFLKVLEFVKKTKKQKNNLFWQHFIRSLGFLKLSRCDKQMCIYCVFSICWNDQYLQNLK